MTFRRIAIFTSIGVLAFVGGGWLARRSVPAHRQLFDHAVLFDRVVARVADYYVDSLDAGDLYDLAVDGMLRELGDPYAGFLRADEYDALELNTTGDYAGLGIRIESNDGWITVVTPLADTPAEEAGVLPGDRIVMVNDRSTEGWTTDDAVTVLRGSAGTPVTVVVSRPGVADLMSFTMERAPIHVNAVRHAQVLEGGIGYVWLEIVTEESARELREEIEGLRRDGATALILDLRYNPGGLLTQGIDVSDLFLDDGAVVVETRARNVQSSRTYRADEPERWADMPVVVLVNEFSASAAEIIAGALQDNDRALVVGVPTFGKGLVQTVFPFGDREVLKLTTGRWYTPSGRSIQRPRPEGEVETASGGDNGAGEGERFLTAAGRELEGGGGIHPDVVFAGTDSVADAFSRRLGAQLQGFQDVLGSVARELSGAATLAEGEVAATPALLSRLRQRVRDRGLDIADAAWEEAAPWVGRELVYRILRYEIGREAEMRRRTADDPLVAHAVSLLRGVRSPRELLDRR